MREGPEGMGGWRAVVIERQGCKKVREKCERGRQGFEREAHGGREGSFGPFEPSFGLQGSCGCDSCGNSWPLIL